MRLSRLAGGVIAVALGCGGGTSTSPGTAAASVTLTPATVDTLFSLGDAVQLTAVAKDGFGVVIPNASITYQSSVTSVAIVSTAGAITSVGNGTTTISATSGAASASVTVRVRQKLVSLSLTPSTTAVTIGRTTAVSASPLDARGNAINNVPAPTFTSSNTSVATVAASGVITGVALGSATITASVTSVSDGTKTATALVNVTTAPPLTATVTLGISSFQPPSVEVSVGGTVTWINNSGEIHDVDFGTPPTHLAAFGSGQRSLNFPTAGTFSYHCNLHAGMEGTVVVR